MSTTRRAFLAQAAAAAVACAAPARGAQDTSTPRRPNFIHILCDDLGYGDLACYGHPNIQTPHLDQLARDGLRLTDCYAAAPVCSPARAGAMTGRHPYRAGIGDWIPEDSPVHLRREEVTVADCLRDAGYDTAFCGKWHLTGTLDGTQPTPGEQGFGHWLATQNNSLPTHLNPVNLVRDGEALPPYDGYSSRAIADDAINFLENRDDDDPFALFVWFHESHEIIASAAEHMAHYPGIEDRKQAEYFANVTQMDHETGRLLAALDRLGLSEDTLVWFTSDNGPETLHRYKSADRSYGSPGPLRGMKLHLYEGGIRVPGILRWPGAIAAGQTSAEPVCGTDLLPTLCALAGVDLPTRVHDGTDVSPVFSGQSHTRERPLYWRYDRAISEPKHALRDGEWKILASADLAPLGLYNLREDPSEKEDLQGAALEQLQMLTRKLQTAHQEVDADWQTYQF